MSCIYGAGHFFYSTSIKVLELTSLYFRNGLTYYYPRNGMVTLNEVPSLSLLINDIVPPNLSIALFAM